MTSNLKLPIIPNNITVHLGKPSEKAANVTVPFIDYVKNVASSEIYPTWPENALRANIYAQISFALNRIYTEYYRSKGYDFDITNSTAFDQSFVYGRDIFQNISMIVDDIFDSYIVRQGTYEPLFAQYCNGTTTKCNGLSQWGSVELANKGYTPYQILQNYYGNNIDIKTNVPVSDISESIPIRPLRLGSTGDDVRNIQIKLNRISTNYPSIPKIYPINGFYDQNTLNAILEFQRIFNLNTDGITGKSTWYKINSIYNAVKKLNELDSEGITLEEIKRQFPGNLSLGSRGIGVETIQYMLKYISLYNPQVPEIKKDGIFGPLTEEAVKDFQKYIGLEPNGIIDDITYSALYDSYRGIINSLPDSQFIGKGRPYPGFPLGTGQKNEYVKYLQEYLNVISEVVPSVKRLSQDGIFGPLTENDVKEFQKYKGITANGIVAINTWDAIVSLYEDIIKGNLVSVNQYPSSNAYYTEEK